MSTPAAFPPSPFDPADPARPRPPGRALKTSLLAGCAALVALVLAAGLIFAIQHNAILAWTLTTLEERVEGRLGPEVPEAAQQRLAAAFATARQAIEDGRFDLVALERAQRKVLAASASDQPFQEAEMIELAEALEAVPRAAGEQEPSP